MPTVTEILDRGARITGLRTSSTERALALQALQQAYRRSVMDAELSLSSFDYTFLDDEDDYALTDTCDEQPVRLYHVALTSQGDEIPIQQVSFQELLDIRDNNTGNSGPGYYAVIGFERIAFWPNPTAGDTIKTWFIPDVPELVEPDPDNPVGSETTPSKIPVAFHWDVLLPGMVVEMLDKDQRAQEAQFWMDRYHRGIARLQEHIGQMGGDANRAYVKKIMSRYRHNDQLGRRW